MAPVLPPIVQIITRAENFRRQLDTGEVRNQAMLARFHQITRARVTQLLHLLDLHPAIRAFAKGLPPTTAPRKAVTEKALKPLLALPAEKQLLVASRMIAGFAAHVAGVGDRGTSSSV
jgi:hypothetical protein